MGNTNKENCYCKECCHDSMIDKMLAGMLASAAIAAMVDEVTEDLPDASPMDLLTKKDYQRMDAYLEKHYGPLREFIDENYVALLMALQQYEKVDFDKRIKAHIVHNIKCGE